ncbi:MAG: ATP-binding protein [Deltaproteobacteria bacterium]|nr:ATP-binding protein [Deltaproteobacteria bacterium]
MYPRFFNYMKSQSFFLLGPRGTGKSTWLRAQFPEALYIDLLSEGLFQEFLRHPESLRERILAQARPKDWVILDEIQRVPELLNEVQRLMSERQQKFILTGSSARKLKKNHANLLAGRAMTKFFSPLTATELGDHFDIHHSLKFGHLPMTFSTESPRDYLKSYVGTYLREEVQQEALVRNLSVFAYFLEVLAFSQGQVVSVSAMATDCGVDQKTAEAYIQLTEDLLIAHRIPVFQKKSKRKMSVKPKFYYFDVGVYRALRKIGPLDSDEEIQGAAIETLIFQEIRAQIHNLNLDLEIFFYRTQNKIEVDFILYGEDGLFAIEVKRNHRIQPEDLKGLALVHLDYPKAKLFLIYSGNEERVINESIHAVPIQKFLKELPSYLQG